VEPGAAAVTDYVNDRDRAGELLRDRLDAEFDERDSWNQCQFMKLSPSGATRCLNQAEAGEEFCAEDGHLRIARQAELDDANFEAGRDADTYDQEHKS
jgi:hypothetical protein